MPLAEAETLMDCNLAPRKAKTTVREPHFQAFDPAADLDRLRQLAIDCECFTPLFGIEDAEFPESLLLDVTGCLHLFGGDQDLASRLSETFRAREFLPRVAIATTIGAAWAAAHFLAKQKSPAVVSSSQLPAVLPPLPLAALRLTVNILSVLQELGLRTISQIQVLPRASIPSRFGPLLLKRLDQAFGDEPEFFVAEKPREPFAVHWEGEFPIKSREVLHAVSQELLEDLLSRLTKRREGLRQLRCVLRDCRRRSYEFHVGFTVPTDHARHTFEMLCLKWERAYLPYEMDSIHLEAVVTGSLQTAQRDLFGHEPGTDKDREVVTLLDRLSNRLGSRTVLRGRLLPEAQPEVAVAYEPCTDPEMRTSIDPECLKTKLSQRPTSLFTQPESIEALAIAPDGLPQSFRWNHQEHHVVRSWQERIETGWWRVVSANRDYFRIEVHTGHHFWIFRRLDQQDWFIHGTFD
jgi:protein ImuB